MDEIDNDPNVKTHPADEVSSLRIRLEDTYRALIEAQRRAAGMEQLLVRLHAVAKHGSARSGALNYLRDELLKAFGEEPEGDTHKQQDMLDG